jgi:hypothetical protein
LGFKSMTNLASVPYVRAHDRWCKSHAKAHPAAEAFLEIAGSASVRLVSNVREGAGDRKRLDDVQS